MEATRRLLCLDSRVVRLTAPTYSKFFFSACELASPGDCLSESAESCLLEEAENCFDTRVDLLPDWLSLLAFLVDTAVWLYFNSCFWLEVLRLAAEFCFSSSLAGLIELAYLEPLEIYIFVFKLATSPPALFSSLTPLICRCLLLWVADDNFWLLITDLGLKPNKILTFAQILLEFMLSGQLFRIKARQ